ncbi:nuclear transport factor 2 family protein [bacterium]|nr:nuclear transport factor 2 family protein [bacterium]MCI0606099.1 nuclear transport factor 2 family protein [bacterium]
MPDEVKRDPARDPQELERLLVSRERAGDVDEMVALYEPHAVLDCANGQLMIGREAIRAFYANQVAMGRKYNFGDQRPAIISGDLALTSTRSPDGNVTAEIARQQSDGSWLWVIDQFSIA